MLNSDQDIISNAYTTSNTGNNGNSLIHESDQHVSKSQFGSKQNPKKEKVSLRRSKRWKNAERQSQDENIKTERHKSGKGKRKAKEKRKYSSFTRRLWSENEDIAIISLVNKYGIRKWTLISRKLHDEYKIYGRSGKQCRER